jgi:hypothetical protein
MALGTGIFLLALFRAGAADFVPPQAYPAERYEQGWQKNPFTLKTAPPPVQRDSFAKDLALGSISGTSDNPTVVLVNTKTRERTPIRGFDDESNGMKIVAVQSEGARKDRYVEVEMAGEKAQIHFDETMIKTASATAQAGQPNPGAPNTGGMRQGTQPGAMGAQRAGNPLATHQTAGAAGMAPVNMAKGPTGIQNNMPPPPVSMGLPPGVNVPVVPTQPAVPGAEAAPIVNRRRFNNVPQPATGTAQ